MSVGVRIQPTERASLKTVRLALRWMLILATALVLAPPGAAGPPDGLTTPLIVAFALSNVALGFLAPAHFRSRKLDYLVVIADTFLVSLALFHPGLENSHLPLVFFLTLLLAALGPDLPRTVAGATLVSGLYLYLTSRGAAAGAQGMSAVLLRVPFLYVVALYYGHLVYQARLDQEWARRMMVEKHDAETFLEITAATTSTLDLHEVLYLIVQRVAGLVNALRCSILTVDEAGGACTVLASSDDKKVGGLKLDLGKYPEVRRAIETREAVVINDVAREPLMKEVRQRLESLGFQSIMVMPMMHGASLLGMLVLRAARSDRRFSPAEITACQVVANASANALRNAMLFEQVRSQARSRQQTAETLQNILDHYPDLIYTTDMKGRLTEFSRGGLEMLGLAAREALGQPCAEIYAEPEARRRVERLLEDGRSIKDLETTVTRRDGTVLDVTVTASLLRDAAGAPHGTIGIIKNVTELKAARRHLLQAEKLSAIGEVVSGVAHELNNPLAGVLGYAQLLMTGPMESRQQRSVERIFESALRCQKIVQNLLAFSRRYPTEKRHLGLNGIIEKTIDLKAYQLKVNNLKVIKTLDPAIPKTMLDFNQIQQVLLNVMNNAQHAVASHRGQGTLTIRTSMKDAAIRLEMIDDGPGIEPEVLGRIFDPFFTTKPVGEGTGLGLSVSYGIVRDHGGRIWADSRVGQGTTITIELPVVDDAGDHAAGEVAGAGPAPSRAGRPLRVLSVDDEPVILDLVIDALGREGHTIDTASSGREALVKLEKGSYDVVVLDLKMPDMDGKQLFHEIRTRWPSIARRVIFASGDTIHPETRRFIDQSGRPCIDKPFKLEVLSSVVARVAGDEPPRAAATRG